VGSGVGAMSGMGWGACERPDPPCPQLRRPLTSHLGGRSGTRQDLHSPAARRPRHGSPRVGVLAEERGGLGWAGAVSGA